jgi:uncharacterized Ntn-hydrolase superfamily protein
MLAAAMTYSIVARDPATGELGATVQSHWFSVGALCPWAQPGVGAVATQSIAEPAHGPNGLERLAAGEPAERALAALLATDPLAPLRQVGIVDAAGRVAAHTGEGCIPHAGHVIGEHWACQANMMYELAGEADELAGSGRAAEAAELYRRAAELAPGSPELRFWGGLALAATGELVEGAAEVGAAGEDAPGLLVLLDRLTPDLAPAAQVVRRRLGR